jgi:hypothetical protein
MHGPLLPWASGPLSGLRSRSPPVSTSGAFPPGAWPMLPSGVLRGVRLVDPRASFARWGPTPCVRFSHRPLDGAGLGSDAPNRIG